MAAQTGGQPAAAPAWLQVTTLALSLGGLAVSAYLTIAHYTTPTTLACPDTGVVNCEKVTTSPESVLLGIVPVALLGLGFYVFVTAMNTPWAWRATASWIRWARLGSLTAGIVFALYLIYTELFTLNAICLWCTSVHVITFLLFALTIPAATSRPAPTASWQAIETPSGNRRPGRNAAAARPNAAGP